MYSFAHRPRWIVLHILVLGAVATFAVAGVWQLSRRAERQERNDEVRRGLARPETDLSNHEPFPSLIDHDVLRVRATGYYDRRNEVILRNRSLDGEPGNHVLTPFIVSPDPDPTPTRGLIEVIEKAMIIDRGWVPADIDEPDVPRAAPPRGLVTIHGLFLRAEPRRPLVPDDPGTGKLESVRRINPPRLAEQLPYDVSSHYVQLRSQEPTGQTLPRIVPPPDLSEGPHLAYAVQWFTFIVIALVVYVILLRREAKKSPAAVSSSAG